MRSFIGRLRWSGVPSGRGRRWSAYWGFVTRYVGANLQGALEYRVSFASQVVAMLINDIIWLVFWLAYFTSFPVVGGWGRDEIVTMWAVLATSFGVSATLCGGAAHIAGMIMRGELDFYLSLPKPPLLHVLISRMDLTAPGDVLFGLLVYAVIITPSPWQIALFGLFTLTGAIIFAAFTIITQSLAFWLGSAEGLAQQFSNAMISFSTYPTVIFRGIVKVALFTIIPAGFVSYMPVQLLRSFSWSMLGGLLLFTVASLALAVWVFGRGLRRYESGNLVVVRQ
jgi:ABC-2 type transport system permease protein